MMQILTLAPPKEARAHSAPRSPCGATFPMDHPRPPLDSPRLLYMLPPWLAPMRDVGIELRDSANMTLKKESYP